MFYKYNKLVSTIYSLFLILALVAFDQLTKILAVVNLMGKGDIVLIENVLELHYLENNGAAFSILEGKQTFFLVLTPILLVIMFYIHMRMPRKPIYMPLNYIIIFIIAGAMGNYIDRFHNRYVIDFIYFSLINFPVFNVADIYVTCSVILLILLILFKYKEADFDELSNAIKIKRK